MVEVTLQSLGIARSRGEQGRSGPLLWRSCGSSVVRNAVAAIEGRRVLPVVGKQALHRVTSSPALRRRGDSTAGRGL
jgi:hypothetical protein